MEVYDNRRGPPYEEPPLQADPGTEHALHRAAPAAAHGDTAAEQTARALGATKFPPTFYIQELLHFRTVV